MIPENNICSFKVFLSVMWHLWKNSPELIILNEFNLLTVYGVFYCFFDKKPRILLLVENDPYFLSFNYGINRKNKIMNILKNLDYFQS